MVSQRDVFYYYERSTISVEDGRIVATTTTDSGTSSYNIPAMNLALVLLGPGCSVTSAAMELLAAANVVVGFSGGQGTPLNSAVEPIVFSTTTSEYRPTEYMQQWAKMWFQDDIRLQKAKDLMLMRLKAVEKFWPVVSGNKLTYAMLTGPNPMSVEEYCRRLFSGEKSVSSLLGAEGAHVKRQYSLMCRTLPIHKTWTRDTNATDGFNTKLTQGNYIAYGLAAVALNVLGISYAFPLMHGKTRRGALVFDIADIVKDSIVTPMAALHADASNDDFRKMLKQFLFDNKILGYLINVLKVLAEV